jgi:hypothetical protein
MKVPFFNDSKHYKTIGTTLVPPGETREVDAALLSGYQPLLAPEPDAPRHIVDVLLAGPVSELLAALPSLAREDLELLGQREQVEAARREVLGAVSELLLDAASDDQDTKGETGQGDRPLPATSQVGDDMQPLGQTAADEEDEQASAPPATEDKLADSEPLVDAAALALLQTALADPATPEPAGKATAKKAGK